MKNILSTFISYTTILMTNRWLGPPRRIINLMPKNFNCKYVDAIKYESNTNLLAIGTNNGYTSLYSINNKKGLYRPLWVNKSFDDKDGVKYVDILPKYFVAHSVFEQTKVYTTKNKLIFNVKWNNTTTYETILDDLYYRFDYFGNVVVYNITSKLPINNYKLKLEGYVRIITCCDSKFFIITDNNIIHMYNTEFIKLIDHNCGTNMLLPRTAIIKRLSNQYFILIGFHSGDIYSVNYLINNIETDDKYEIEYQLKNTLNAKHPYSIIKFIISANLFFVFDSDYNFTCYKLNTLTPTIPLEKVYSIKLDAPYTSILEYSNNYVFMNGFKGIKILDYSGNNPKDYDEDDKYSLPID